MESSEALKPEVVKLNVRLEPELRESAAVVAKAMGMSLNSFIVQATKDAVRYHYGRLTSQRRPSMAEVPQHVDAVFEGLAPVRQQVPRVGANQPCPCGSGQKYKRCHGQP